MTNLTLNGWKTSVATALIETVPLQDFESALVLADNYIASTGGWVPDDPGNPTGPGVPASGASMEEAIQQIFDEQLSRVYTFDVTGTLSFRTVFLRNLEPNLSDQDALAAIEAVLEDFVEQQLGTTSLEFINLDSFSDDVVSGPTTSSERAAIQSEITGGGKIINPKAIALSAARARFALDTTYNVSFAFTEVGKELFMMIEKYESTSYQTLDSSATNKFALRLNRNSYKVTGGITLPA